MNNLDQNKQTFLPRSLTRVSLLIALTLMPLWGACHDHNYIIATGSRGGNYFNVGRQIADLLTTCFDDHRFLAIETGGSNENVSLLKERVADFAIVQRNVLLQNLYDESRGIKNIEILLPLYREELLIYVHGESEVPYDEFMKSVRDGTIKRIGLTNRTGSSYQIFNKAAQLSGLSLAQIEIIENNYNGLISDFRAGEIDALVSFSLPLSAVDSIPESKKVFFDEKTAEFLASRIQNIGVVKLSPDDQNGTRSDGYTLGSWSFLVGLNNSIAFAEYDQNLSLVTCLVNGFAQENSAFSEIIKASLEEFQHENNQAFLSRLPVNYALGDHVKLQVAYGDYLPFLVIICLLFIAAIFVYRTRLDGFDRVVFWLRYRHLIVGAFILIIAYIGCIEYMVYAERKLFVELSLNSQLLDMTKRDLHFWVVVTNLTGDNNGIFPLSATGKFMLSISAIILWVGSIIIGLIEIIIVRTNRKKKKGMSTINYKKHIVLTGWNDATPILIKESRNAISKYHKGNNHIVCITDDPEKIIESDLEIKKMHAKGEIDFVAGDAREADALKQANVQYANTVVLLAEDSSASADERTMLRALAISKYCRAHRAQTNMGTGKSAPSQDKASVNSNKDSIYIIAELNHDKYAKDMRNCDVNEVVSTAIYGKNIITQSMLNHGVSKVLDEVLTFNDFNEFYIVDLNEEQSAHLRNRTFDELLVALRRIQVLLIAIKVVYLEENGDEIIDEDELKELLSKDKLKRQIIVNPILEDEIKRKADEDDQLIVFAQDGDVMRKRLREVFFPPD